MTHQEFIQARREMEIRHAKQIDAFISGFIIVMTLIAALNVFEWVTK